MKSYTFLNYLIYYTKQAFIGNISLKNYMIIYIRCINIFITTIKFYKLIITHFIIILNS